jgi:penicillin-binding protein 1C
VRYIFYLILFSVASFVILDRLSPVDLSPTQDLSRMVKAEDGALLYVTTNGTEKWRFKTDIEKIDPHFIKMLIAFEDRRFYQHIGWDPLAMGRALYQLITHRRVVSGGSTITMQLARLLEPKERTVVSKLIEMVRALQLEWHYSKAEILAAYLTLTPYGGNVEGIVAASLRYYGKLPHSLSAQEAALLVSLPQSPERYRPDKHLEASIQARNRVLLRAKKQHLISEHVYQQALASTPPKQLYPYPRLAAHLSQKIIGQDDRGDVVETTLHKLLQQQLETYLKQQIVPKGSTISLIVVRNSDSAIMAYLGSHDMFSREVEGFVDMAAAIRSPGSTLKPFIYALGFEKRLIHPQTIIVDEEVNYQNYRPENFSHAFSGEVTIAKALQHSLNIPAVKVLERVGVEEFVEKIKSHTGEMVIPKGRASLPVALGGMGMRMLPLSRLYVSLANGGSSLPIYYLKSKKGTLISKLLSAKAANVTTAILRQVPPPYGFVDPSDQIAYKTGTSYGYRDAWTIAYNRAFTVAVLVGRPDNAPQIGLTGMEMAAPLAFEVFTVIDRVMGQARWVEHASVQQHAPKGLRYFEIGMGKQVKKLRFLYPEQGGRYKSARCGDVRVPIRVENGESPYVWYIDGVLQDIREDQVDRVFTPGGHTITIIDSNGATITRDIWVDKPEC